VGKGRERNVRGLLCHCRHHLDAEDDETLLGLVREHLIREHPAIPPSDEQVEEIINTRAYDLHYAHAYTGSFDTAEEELGIDPY
jgi:hypothetical protein